MHGMLSVEKDQARVKAGPTNHMPSMALTYQSASAELDQEAGAARAVLSARASQ